MIGSNHFHLDRTMKVQLQFRHFCRLVKHKVVSHFLHWCAWIDSDSLPITFEISLDLFAQLRVTLHQDSFHLLRMLHILASVGLCTLPMFYQRGPQLVLFPHTAFPIHLDNVCHHSIIMKANWLSGGPFFSNGMQESFVCRVGPCATKRAIVH